MIPVVKAVITIVGCFSFAANASGPQVPHVFTDGTVAKADEVNANFQELADRIAEGFQLIGSNTSESYSAIDYIQSNGSTISYSIPADVLGDGASQLQEVDAVVWDETNPDNIIITKTRTSSGTPSIKKTYIVSQEGVFIQKIEAGDGTSTVYQPPVLLMPTIMKKGQVWTQAYASNSKMTIKTSKLVGEVNLPGSNPHMSDCLVFEDKFTVDSVQANVNLRLRCRGVGTNELLGIMAAEPYLTKQMQ